MTQLRAGHDRQDITPEPGVWMMGYAGRKRPAQAVHDRLQVDAVALAGEGEPILLLALDVAGLGDTELDAFKQAIGEATSLSIERVLVNTSHTHAGPNVRRRSSIPFNDAYLRWMTEQAAAAGAGACDDLRPTALEAGEADLDIGCNRRERDAQGQVRIGLAPDQPRLPRVSVWRLARHATDDIIVFNTPIHGTTVQADNLQISADWMGAARRAIETARPCARAVFLQGFAGNQTPYREPSNFEMVARHGETAAKAVEQALNDARPLKDHPLRLLARDVPLPYQDGGTEPCALRGLRVGEAMLLSLAGEPFVEYALGVREIAPAASLMTLGYTDGSIGYLPTERAFAEGGYETVAYRHRPGGRPFHPGLERVIREHLQQMISDLATEPWR